MKDMTMVRALRRRSERKGGPNQWSKPKPSRRNKPIRAANGKKVLIGARVSQTFHRRIETERVRREMSLQELLVTALRAFFQMPVNFDRAEIRYYTDDPNYTQKQADERNAWTDLWDRYTAQMPREKIQIMIHAMEWDLKIQKSSRRKRSSSVPALSVSTPTV